jgi:hypothetical protein
VSVGPREGRSGQGGARPRRLNGRDRDGSVGEAWDGRRGRERGWEGVEHWIERGVVRVGGNGVLESWGGDRIHQH